MKDNPYFIRLTLQDRLFSSISILDIFEFVKAVHNVSMPRIWMALLPFKLIFCNLFTNYIQIYLRKFACIPEAMCYWELLWKGLKCLCTLEECIEAQGLRDIEYMAVHRLYDIRHHRLTY